MLTVEAVEVGGEDCRAWETVVAGVWFSDGC